MDSCWFPEPRKGLPNYISKEYAIIEVKISIMAATNLNTVRSTIEARLATELATSPVIPVVFNMAFDSTTEDTLCSV